MVTYDIRVRQDKLLEILLAIDKVCKAHHLRYYIMAGTMLGAVRHSGFIPWDDDADIGIPRADYEQLIAHAKEWFPEQYEFVCGENDTDYPLPFGKIQDARTTLIERASIMYVGGVYVDIFPLDGVPTGKIAQQIHFAQYQFYKKLLFFLFRNPYKHGKGPRSWVPLLCRKVTTRSKVQRRIRQLLTKYDFDNQSLIADYDDGSKGIMDKQILGTPIPVRFCGKELLGVEQSDAYLKQKYEDYMTIPKQEHRKKHQCFYLDMDMPYKEYKA
ncbi:MAG: LicD family protein [Candidatus Symbiothrix sp.]|jgi:lipopolysaccharide cholinephosphotransferase|nr:LicD family protein [Candidatus Symbiothrix sp.]